MTCRSRLALAVPLVVALSVTTARAGVVGGAFSKAFILAPTESVDVSLPFAGGQKAIVTAQLAVIGHCRAAMMCGAAPRDHTKDVVGQGGVDAACVLEWVPGKTEVYRLTVSIFPMDGDCSSLGVSLRTN
jgi:hypothetical protein